MRQAANKVTDRKPGKGRMGRPTQFPGICADARILGVHRRTLARVLNGEWQSKVLMARYKQLQGKRLTTDEQLRIADFNRRQARKGSIPS